MTDVLLHARRELFRWTDCQCRHDYTHGRVLKRLKIKPARQALKRELRRELVEA